LQALAAFAHMRVKRLGRNSAFCADCTTAVRDSRKSAVSGHSLKQDRKSPKSEPQGSPYSAKSHTTIPGTFGAIERARSRRLMRNSIGEQVRDCPFGSRALFYSRGAAARIVLVVTALAAMEQVLHPTIISACTECWPFPILGLGQRLPLAVAMLAVTGS
jgi:hypothetical protein